jgi:DNA-binding NarL/FixJ family response regulator
MSGDLLSLRLLLVTASEPQQSLWREGAAMASILVDFDAGDAASARILLAKGGVDICVLSEALSENDRVIAIRSARRAKNPAPILLISTSDSDAHSDKFDGVLPKAASAEEARKLVEVCIRVRVPTKTLIAAGSVPTRKIVRKILSASRFVLEVHEASEGHAALDKLRKGNFGMVFLDRGMPGLDRTDPVTQIKHEAPDVAVIIMTSASNGTTAGRDKLPDVLALLQKPFYPPDVDAVLKRYYGLHAFDA